MRKSRALTPKPSTLKLREIPPVFGQPPDSPEGVALALFRILMVVEGAKRAEALDFYAECLTTARGERQRGADGKRH
jgi:hypothetical protein